MAAHAAAALLDNCMVNTHPKPGIQGADAQQKKDSGQSSNKARQCNKDEEAEIFVGECFSDDQKPHVMLTPWCSVNSPITMKSNRFTVKFSNHQYE